MQVNFKTMTPDIETTIVEIARVSSSRKDKKAAPEKLINYLIRNKHWSPFEHGFITYDITTSRAMSAQLCRHRSFYFQEFSQRYQEVPEVEEVELRKQSEDNRQSSTEVLGRTILRGSEAGLGLWNISHMVESTLNYSREAYEKLIKLGVARECARMILPMASTTRIYMTGNVRSWIHFLDVRDDGHAQKEMQLIAQAIKADIIERLPLISNALEWKT